MAAERTAVAETCVHTNKKPTCNCGSIIKGHLAAFVMIAPFSTDNGSIGKPSLAHLARAVSSVSKSSGLTPTENGMPRCMMSGVQQASTRWFRRVMLKGPAYETNAAANKTSPICGAQQQKIGQSAAASHGRQLRNSSHF